MSTIRICYCIAVYLLLVLASPASAIERIEPFLAEYTVMAKGLSAAQLTRTLRIQEDGSYRLATDMRTRGLVSIFRKEAVSEYSIFTLEEGKIVPKEYVYNRNYKQKKTRNSIDFDWQQGIAKVIYKEQQSELALEEGIQDSLSTQLALRWDLRQGVKELTHRVVEKDRIRDYHFKVEGEELLETRLGKLKTIRVKRIHGSERSTTFWCAIDADYLLVKIEQENKGTTITVNIRKYQGPGDDILVPVKPSPFPKQLSRLSSPRH
ncbi:MAG: DUF3108 domain-containing protein [Gammaproteobacteria bacterium]|nr:DUF3108 domain-containing protein [Gammaproteobacteria bacterium]